MDHDVAARLAQGRPAVDDFATCVAACRLRGFSHPDLSVHAAVHDLYGGEDGLDLLALEADCAGLRSAATAAGEAAAVAREQLRALGSAWTGPGVQACADFLRRHCEAAESVAGAWQRAAQRGGALLDELWRAVEARVAATVSAFQGVAPHWLPAAQAVLSGSADENAAAIVDQQVRPFVETVLAGQWVPDMRAATAVVCEAYRAALDGAGVEDVRFDVPGDLGPRATAVRMPEVGALWQDAMSAWPGPLGAPPISEPMSLSAPVPEPAPPVVPATPVASAEPVAPAMASSPAPPEPGVPDPPRLADPVLPEPELGAPDLSGLDVEEPESVEPDEVPESDESEPDPEPDHSADESAESPVDPDPDPEHSDEPGEATEAADPPAPELTPAPDCADSPPPDPSTPCEMAADELPQVGR